MTVISILEEEKGGHECDTSSKVGHDNPQYKNHVLIGP